MFETLMNIEILNTSAQSPLSGDLGGLILLLPFAGFVLLGLFGKKYFNKSAGLIATA